MLEQPAELAERALRKLVVDMKESVSEHIEDLSSTELSIDLRQYYHRLNNELCGKRIFKKSGCSPSGNH